MKKLRFNQVIIIVLLALSLIFFCVQYLLFDNINETGFLFFQDLWFLPLNILMVSFILNKILESREKRERLEHINIVISAFFSEMGTYTLELLNPLISQLPDIRKLLDMSPEWNNKSFEEAAKSIKHYSFITQNTSEVLERLKSELPLKKAYLLQMFSNPNLLEHNTFTDMLWALYHLIDELENREDTGCLPETDIRHISGDIIRAYGLLVYEWVYYMRHLKERYPYLWSLAIRKSPFAKNSIIISC